MSNRKLIISSTACLLVFSIIMGVVLTIGPVDVSAKQASSSELKAELKELQAQKAEIAEKLKELEKQQSANMSDMESIINRKGNIEQQIALLHTQIINVTEQINAYSLLIADKQEELQAARERLAELDKLHKERVRAMEEEGELSYWSVLFQASSFSDFLDRLNMIAEIAAADRRRLNELAEAAEAVAQAKKELAEDKAELEKNRADMEASQKELDAKNAEVDVLLQELVIIAGDLENLHNQFEKEEEDFLDQIADKEKEYNNQLNKEKEESKKASQQASKNASIQASKNASIQASKNQASGGASNPSGVIWLQPTKYTRVSSPFGYRWHPTTGEWSFHKGVDLPAAKGTPIYASRSGKVTIATYHATAGNYVTINHGDGYSSTYMHMTHYTVKWGQEVEAGQIIGYVGSTGRSTGPHLHFGIIHNGTYVDPMDYIG